MGKGITQPGNEPAEQPSAADALAAKKEQEKTLATAGATKALAAPDGPLTGVEASLNKPVEEAPTASEDAETAEGEEKAVEVSLEQVQALMSKKPSQLTDPEAELLGTYYTQEAERCNARGESMIALMMHLRALLASLKLDFLNPPKETQSAANKDATPQSGITGETPLAAPEANEKPTTIETLANEVGGVPAIILLALAKKQNQEITKANLTIIADNTIAELGEEKPDKNNPIKYLTAYLEKSMALKKYDPSSQKALAAQIAEYHSLVNDMYANKEISYTAYYAWASKMQAATSMTPAGAPQQSAPQRIENIQPGALFNMLTPYWKKQMNRKGERVANINLIEKMVIAAGYSIRMAAAMICNAWSESCITNEAIGDKGKSVGIFQLHQKGRGAGMSVAQRQIPQENIGKMLRDMDKQKIVYKGRSMKLIDADRAGASIEELTNLFCYYMEMPKNRAEKGRKRAEQASKMFSQNFV